MEVYASLREHGTLAADSARGYDPDWADAYAWMREQMTRRVPAYGGGPLWWAYAEKPDLRRSRHAYFPGEYVRLELEVPSAEVQLSDYLGWHYVLSGDYHPLPEEVESDLDALEVHIQREDRSAAIRRSWERIFAGEIPGVPDSERYSQATFEWLRMRDVRRVTRFQGRCYRRYFGPEAIGPDDLPPLEGYGDTVRIGDRFVDRSISDDRVLTLRGYRRLRRTFELICEDERGGCVTFHASGLFGSRRFERLPGG